MPRKPKIIENVTILDVKRHGTSVNGNPTHRLITDHGTFLTQSDSQVGYGAENYRPTYALTSNYDDATGDHFYSRQDLYCTVTLTTTAAGRVYKIEGDDAFTLRKKFES